MRATIEMKRKAYVGLQFQRFQSKFDCIHYLGPELRENIVVFGTPSAAEAVYFMVAKKNRDGGVRGWW